ncbi:hypothetical protein MRB53_036981 [Persea americana]|nr:hypothetical protein MRB53_036981 [Persea americana]
MPSIHSLTLSPTLLPLLLSILLPPRSQAHTLPAIHLTTTPTLPQSSLPPTSLTLKYIALGHGTQNYTCSSPPSSAIAIGAIATLYDVTPLFTAQSTILNPSPSPGQGQSQSQSQSQGPLYTQLTCQAASQTNNAPPIPNAAILGRHYFTSTSIPIFDLYNAPRGGALLAGKKVANATAPTTACANLAGLGAVDWLKLVDNGSGVSFGGVGEVYRVETGGGKAPGCGTGSAAGGGVTSEYAALYWFYGSYDAGARHFTLLHDFVTFAPRSTSGLGLFVLHPSNFGLHSISRVHLAALL